jgi:5-methyltetrahydropteroyltriglutamate--homocysteine methyltransferase
VPQIESGLTNFFPRPEEYVKATRELDRGRRSREDVESILNRWTGEVFKLESEKGFSWITGGHLGWQDLFRPYVEASEGLVTGPLTRWFTTNTFYRRPVVEKLPALRPGALATSFPKQGRPLATIVPGPYTFSELAENRSSEDHEIVASAISTFLANAVRELAQAGVGLFIVHEPLLVVRPPDKKREKEILGLYKPLEKALQSGNSLLWTYFGDAAPVMPLLKRLPVGGVGVDLSETRPSELTSFVKTKSLGLGCIDARTSLPEDPRDIAEIARDLDGRLSPRGIVLGPSVPLDLLPWEPACVKADVLSQSARLIRGE